MKITKLLKTLCIAALAAASVCLLSSCINSGNNTNDNPNGLTGGVAATVNGTEIDEDTITNQIQDWRNAYGYSDEDAWGQYLASSSTTPEEIREQILDSLVDDELVKQAIAENNIVVTDADIDSSVDKMKANYDSDDAWQQALQSAGWTEDRYRAQVELSLQTAKLKDVVAPAEEPSQDEILSSIQMYKSSIDGAKRSSHILFDSTDTQTAQEVLDKINSGELDFADAAKQYSKDTGSAANGGDVGWDKLTTFVTAYQDALDGLSLGQVSGLVTSEYGIHIIKCTDVYTAPADITDVSQVPEEFVQAISDSIESSNQDTAYNNWLSDYKDKANIVINPFPENVPYNLDMSKYATSDDNSEGAAVSDADESDADETDADETDATEDEGSEATEDGSSDSDESTEDEGATEAEEQ